MGSKVHNQRDQNQCPEVQNFLAPQSRSTQALVRRHNNLVRRTHPIPDESHKVPNLDSYSFRIYICLRQSLRQLLPKIVQQKTRMLQWLQ